MGWAAVALLLLLSACSENRPAGRRLRVPLPEGWSATPGTSGALEVGPKGRVVLTLERRDAALPVLKALEAAVEAEGASVTHAEASGGSVLVRYAKPNGAEALLLARPLDGRTLLLCATTVDAEFEELGPAQTVCVGAHLEAAQPER